MCSIAPSLLRLPSLNRSLESSQIHSDSFFPASAAFPSVVRGKDETRRLVYCQHTAAAAPSVHGRHSRPQYAICSAYTWTQLYSKSWYIGRLPRSCVGPNHDMHTSTYMENDALVNQSGNPIPGGDCTCGQPIADHVNACERRLGQDRGEQSC
ncbi:hypothetical protein MKEN_01016700 [Mycena kentingensis (nom. inval.)]|nr:hypothetical protein MKEN_01016700 [Mycena kentingensis (nom. inval.)]